MSALYSWFPTVEVWPYAVAAAVVVAAGVAGLVWLRAGNRGPQ